ncbi:MAG: Peptidase propeptide and YPEB domain-containing protein [Chloroflexi bacterium]|nr:MAG: Peptidase propeptide and YPEB domain-containing protein [Chloroflexota bacterium]
MKKTPQRLAASLAAGALATAGIAGGGLLATGGDNEEPITGEALERASQAALDHIGEGQVTETEVDDEESKYEVEITRPDGTQVDVQLDASFNVVGTEDDGTEDDGLDDESDGDDDG